MPTAHPWNRHNAAVAGYPSSLLAYRARKRMEALLLEKYQIDPPPPKDSEEYKSTCEKRRCDIWDEIIGFGTGGLPELEGGFDNNFIPERVCLPCLNYQRPFTDLNHLRAPITPIQQAPAVQGGFGSVGFRAMGIAIIGSLRLLAE
jgi:hypothetical protein